MGGGGNFLDHFLLSSGMAKSVLRTLRDNSHISCGNLMMSLCSCTDLELRRFLPVAITLDHTNLKS
jgi:hypothetical protein